MDGRISQKKLRIVQLKLVELTRCVSPKSINLYSHLLQFYMVFMVCCDVDIFKLTASAQYIYREVYDI